MKKIIKYGINRIGYTINRKFPERLDFEFIYNKYKEYTMIPKSSYIENLLLCENNRHLEGDVIECGTWKGGMIAGMANVLKSGRRYVLFDSFEGLPKAKEIDGVAALKWQEDINSPQFYNNCKTDEADAIKLMDETGVEYTLKKGWFEKTIPAYKNSDPIAFLRLDGDWYESILVCLQYLFPQVVKKGIIIIDDYYVWDGTSRAVHDYLSSIKSKSRIFNLHGGIAYVVKED